MAEVCRTWNEIERLALTYGVKAPRLSGSPPLLVGHCSETPSFWTGGLSAQAAAAM